MKIDYEKMKRLNEAAQARFGLLTEQQQHRAEYMVFVLMVKTMLKGDAEMTRLADEVLPDPDKLTDEELNEVLEALDNWAAV